MNTPDGRNKSNAYNMVIQKNMVSWAMIDQLKNPKLGFEDVRVNVTIDIFVRLGILIGRGEFLPLIARANE